MLRHNRLWDFTPFRLLWLVGALFLASGAGSPAAAQRPTRDWTPSERAVIGDFRTIIGVATTYDRVYAVSPQQVLVWRPATESWEGPFTPPDPAMMRGVRVALADPLDNSLWLVGADRWLHFEPELRIWTVGAAPERIQGVAFDLANPIGGPLLRTASGWLEVPRGGLSTIPARAPQQPLLPESVSEFLRDHPAVSGASAAVLLDGRLRQVEYTAVARSFDRLGWYLGTAGLGLFYLPEGAAIPQRLPFGVAGPSVTALFAAPGGVWAVSERTGFNEAALTWIASDLREFRYVEGPAATGLPFTTARRLIGLGTDLFAATDRGLARIEPGRGTVELLDEGRGLPDSRVYAVTARQGWLGVGTARGAARLTDSLIVIPVAPELMDEAYAVAIAADTTWVGTDRGLFFTLGRSGDLVRPAGTDSPEFDAPVIALAWMGPSLAALTRDRLFWRDGARWRAGPELDGDLGSLRAFAVYRDGFWVAGERGVGWVRPGFPPVRPLVDGDLPGDARDVAVDADHLWVAAAGGVVRFDLDAVWP